MIKNVSSDWNTENVEFIVCLWSFPRRAFLYCVSNIQLGNKIQKILQGKSLYDQVIFRWNSFMKNNAQKISFIPHLSIFFKIFENLNHDLTLRTLSCVYIHGFIEERWGGVYTPHKILISACGIELKLELVLVFDRSRW